MTNLEKYEKTWEYSRIKNDLDKYGIWEILGEDPNCDLGGHHSSPTLIFLKGKLKDVIKVAVDIPGFWTWGAGGSFRYKGLDIVYTPEEYKKLKDSENEMLKEKADLESKLTNLNNKLNSIKQ